MLTPDYYLHCTDALMDLLAVYDDAVIADIARRLVKTGYVTDTAKMQIRQVQEMGLLYDDIIQRIAQCSDATGSIVKSLFEDAGVESVKIDNRVYAAAGMKPVGLRASPTMLQMLQAGYENTNGTLKNLTLTTANTAQQAYISACDLAMIQVQSGTMSYQDAIRRAISSMASAGTHVLYPSGRTDRIEVAARRAVLSGVGKTCRTIGECNASSMNCDLMELSAHAGARPSHAAWQGKIVSLSGRKGYLSKSDIGYDTGDGFGGWNCRHDWYPFIPGISTPNYNADDLKKIDEMTVAYNGQTMSYYDATQVQRKLERDIRETKRKMSATSAARDAATDKKLIVDLDTDFNVQSKKLLEQRNALADFLRQTNFLDESSRTQSYGFGRSTAGKASYAARKIKEYDALIGTMTAIGTPVTGISDHFAARALARKISVNDAFEALTNPLETVIMKPDEQNRSRQGLIGKRAHIIINPDAGNLVTIWETQRKTKKRHGVV